MIKWSTITARSIASVYYECYNPFIPNQIAKLISIETPNKYLLNGLLFGPKGAKNVIIFVHGLTGNAFSGIKVVTPLADKETAVITFTNRGGEKIAKIKRVDKRRSKGSKSYFIGEAHETFTDCVDDIQGVVNFAKRENVKNIFLVGHSTGCQKSIYYLAQRGKQKDLKGVVLLCPISDYADFIKFTPKEKIKELYQLARNLIASGKPHELLPQDLWPQQHDAQRFLSLYTPESEEEIFCYAQAGKKPTTLQKVRIPILVVLAEKDEFRDRPMAKIAKWFTNNSKTKHLKIITIKKALHSFNGLESQVAREVRNWLISIPAS